MRQAGRSSAHMHFDPVCALPPPPSCSCSWRALEVALRTAVDAGGDAAAYRQQRWKQGKWWWWMGPGGTMQLAGKGRFTQMRCPPGMAGEQGASAAAAEADAEAAH